MGDGEERCRSGAGLEALPAELLARVLSCLSARDLCALSACSRRMAAASREPGLWEHLCRCRFPPEVLDDWEVAGGSLSQEWKKAYFVLAQREAAGRGGTEGQEDPGVARAWRELCRALWDQPPPPRPALSLSNSSVHPLLLSFRRRHNLQGPRVQRLRTEASAAGQVGGCPAGGGACDFEILAAGLAACRRCGGEHACSDACLNLQPDPEGVNLVCPITGRCCGVAGLDAPGGAGGASDRDRDPEDEGFFSERGALGRAYTAGYEAAAAGEPDLRRLGFGL